MAKHFDFTCVYFKHPDIDATVRENQQAKAEPQFEFKLNGRFFGLITYAVNIPISMANDKVLTELHELLINPLNNAVQYHQAK